MRLRDCGEGCGTLLSIGRAVRVWIGRKRAMIFASVRAVRLFDRMSPLRRFLFAALCLTLLGQGAVCADDLQQRATNSAPPKALKDGPPLIFADGFESGDFSFWGSAVGNDPFVRMGSAAISVDESASTVSIEVVVANLGTEAVSVQWGVTDSTAVNGIDYSASGGTLDIPAGSGSSFISITILEDVFDELDEAFSVSLISSSGAELSSPIVTTVTIRDNDVAPSISFADAALTVAEGSPSLTLQVVLSSASGLEVAVDFNTADGTAGAGLDYTAATGTLTFPAGETTTSVTVPLLDDTLDEIDEAFSVGLTNPQNGTVVAPATAAITISDDDAPPEVFFDADTATVAENAGALDVAVVLSAASSFEVSVGFSTTGGTASGGADYTETTGTLTIPAGETGGTISLVVLDDALNEPTEALSLQLADPVNAALGTPAAATINISDDDSAPEISLVSAVATSDESAASVELTAELSAVSGFEVSIDYATSDDSAVSGSDYTGVGGTLTIPAGQTSAAISVPIVDDTLDESDETFTLALADPVNAVLVAPEAAVVTISDNDSPPEVALGVATSVVGEGAPSIVLQVVLSSSSGLEVAVDFETADGTAGAGLDYTAAAGTLTLPAGETTASVTVALLDDTLDELDENFTLALGNPQNAVLGEPSSTAVTITDNDDAPEVAFDSGGVTVGEGDGTVAVAVALSTVSALDVTVDFTSADQTGNAGLDYTLTSGTLNIPAGQSGGSIPIAILDDSLDEPGETLSLLLTNSVNAALVAPSTFTVTIADNDAAPEVSFVSATASTGEGAASVVLTVELSAVSGFDVTVAYSTTDGSARSGSDYTLSAGSLIIPAGETTGSITVPILEDGLDESDETFTVALATPENALLVEPSSAVVTVSDNDEPPEVSLAAGELAVSRERGSVSVVVSMSAVSALDVAVDYASADISTSVGEDYVPAVGNLDDPCRRDQWCGFGDDCR